MQLGRYPPLLYSLTLNFILIDCFIAASLFFGGCQLIAMFVVAIIPNPSAIAHSGGRPRLVYEGQSTSPPPSEKAPIRKHICLDIMFL
jgi:hypothetical protein